MKGHIRYTEFLRSAVPFDDDWSSKCMVRRFLQAICGTLCNGLHRIYEVGNVKLSKS